jgi:hypothetical protein
MKPTSFEKDLLIKYFEVRQFNSELVNKSINKIRLQSRWFSAKGFVTTFKKHECLKVAEGKQNEIWGEIGAYINRKKLYSEFLFFIGNDYLSMIEGFTYEGNLWPKKIKCYEIFKIKVQYISENGQIEKNPLTCKNQSRQKKQWCDE